MEHFLYDVDPGGACPQDPILAKWNTRTAGGPKAIIGSIGAVVASLAFASCTVAADRDPRAETSPEAFATMVCMAELQRRIDGETGAQKAEIMAQEFDRQTGIIGENSNLTPEDFQRLYDAGTEHATVSRTLVDCIHLVLSDPEIDWETFPCPRQSRVTLP